MQKSKFILIGSLLVSLLTLSGCFPSVYKIDIQQGNIITQDMVNQLRPGMNRAQVNYLMGTPLILDPFHADRWDYIYSIQPGGGTMHQENITLFFNNNQLVSLSGDFQPGKTREEEIAGSNEHKASTDHSTENTSDSLETQIINEVDSVKSIDIPKVGTQQE